MQKILVTGATGFLGRHVVSQLCERGLNVVATSRSITNASKENWFHKVDYKEFDINNTEDSQDLYSYFGKPDKCIHLAWEGLPDYKNDFHLKVNLPAHTSFLVNLFKNGLKDITVAGTCLEYGMQEGCLSESMTAMPGVPYAIAKNSLMKALMDLNEKMDFSIKWLRLFYLYGPGQNPSSLLPQLQLALEKGDPVFNMSGGQQERDFIHVDKAASIIIRASLQNKVTGIINCCSGKPVKVISFVKDYLEKNNSSIELNTGYYPYTDYEPFRFWGDTTKLESIPDEC